MIWLIGNKGMLGREIEEQLKQMGAVYHATDSECDIRDYERLRAEVFNKEVSWIINCSAYTAVDKAEDEPELAFAVNADGVMNIAKVAKEKSAKLIHVSTDYVYSDGMHNDHHELESPAPIGVYGKSKLQGEENIKSELEAWFILRTSWLYGAYGKNFVTTMLDLFKTRDEVRVVSDQWGSPTYSRDLASMIITIIKRNSCCYGVYNYSNEGKTNWYEFAKTIYNIAHRYNIIKNEVDIKPIFSHQFPSKAKRPENSYMSKDKIRKEFAVSIDDWHTALERFLEQK